MDMPSSERAYNILFRREPLPHPHSTNGVTVPLFLATVLTKILLDRMERVWLGVDLVRHSHGTSALVSSSCFLPQCEGLKG